MAANRWELDVDGSPYNVVLERDAENAKTIIRVNGRIAARPMSDDDTVRDFMVGSTKYQIRKSGRGFDLDVAPTVFGDEPPVPKKTFSGTQTRRGTSPSTSTTRTPPRKAAANGSSSKAVVGVISGLLLLSVIGAGARYVRPLFEYHDIPWKTWTSPDNNFRADFPGDPERIANGLKGTYKNHHYFLEWAEFELPSARELDGGQADKIMRDVFAMWRKREGATVSDLRSSYFGKTDGLSFDATVPASSKHPAGKVKGSLAIYKNRVFAVYTVTPTDEPSLGLDTNRFLGSFTLPE